MVMVRWLNAPPPSADCTEVEKSLFGVLIIKHSCYDILALLKNALDLTSDDGIAPQSLLVSNGSAGNG